MASTVLRAVAQRSARAEAQGARALRTLAVSESQSQSEQGFVAQLNSALENPSRREQEPKRSWNGRWMTGAFAVSFAASTMTVAYGKERVSDKFAPKEVVLYQYDACPFCNKVKGNMTPPIRMRHVLCFLGPAGYNQAC